MKLLKMTLMLSAAVLLFAQADTTLQKAIRKETLEGDLKGAIELYRKAIAQAAKDRVTAAQALVHMGACYERLGDAEAHKAYERVVREYADQREAAAQARAKLAGGVAPRSSGMVTRQVWTGFKLNPLGKVSPDGRVIAFTDWKTDDLIVRDLASGQERNLTKGSGETPLFPAISRDGKQVAYASWTKQRGQLRLLDLNGEGAKPRTLFTAAGGVQVIGPIDWSPDGKWLAIQMMNNDGSGQVAAVSTADGSVRILKPNTNGFGEVFISPDGKYVAYDLPSGENHTQQDIYTIAADGSRETPVVVHPANDKLLGWTPDGSHLLFTSDRSGSGIWAQPVSAGRAQGEPKIIKSDINPIGMGLTRSGALYYATYTSGEDVYVASMDFATGKAVTPPALVPQKNLGYNNEPQWSPDGKYLAYHSMPPPGGGGERMLVIRAAETGKIRELRPVLGRFTAMSWSPDGAFIVAKGQGPNRQAGLFRIDAQSGEATPLVMHPEALGPAGWSADRKTFYFVKNAAPRNVVFAYDMQTGRQRPIEPGESWVQKGRPNSLPTLSPDGTMVAAERVLEGQNASSLRLIPEPVYRAAGGQGSDVPQRGVRELLRLSEPERIRGCMWSPDARFVICAKTFANDYRQQELWSIPVDGGTPHRIELGDVAILSFSIHPDGRQVAFAKSGSNVEVWVMENFLPTLHANRQ